MEWGGGRSVGAHAGEAPCQKEPLCTHKHLHTQTTGAQPNPWTLPPPPQPQPCQAQGTPWHTTLQHLTSSTSSFCSTRARRERRSQDRWAASESSMAWPEKVGRRWVRRPVSGASLSRPVLGSRADPGTGMPPAPSRPTNRVGGGGAATMDAGLWYLSAGMVPPPHVRADTRTQAYGIARCGLKALVCGDRASTPSPPLTPARGTAGQSRCRSSDLCQGWLAASPGQTTQRPTRAHAPHAHAHVD